MVLSMTGYGRAGALLHGRDIKVELRSVNARFFEYSSRLPRSCAFLEDKLKKLVASKVSRGKVELSLSIQTVTAADTVVTVNWQLAEGYRAALNAMAERMDLKNDVSVGMLSRFPDGCMAVTSRLNFAASTRAFLSIPRACRAPAHFWRTS